MSCSCIGMWFVTGVLYVLVRILEGIGYGNHYFAIMIITVVVVVEVIWFRLVIGILMDFVLVFGICLEMYESLKIDMLT